LSEKRNKSALARAMGMKIIIYSKEKVEGVGAQTTDFSKILSIIKNL